MGTGRLNGTVLSQSADRTGAIIPTTRGDGLERGIGQINDDRRNYYALTYTPTNAALDGTYRRIEVKVKRPGVDVRSRSGYLAVPANEASPVLTFEVPALAAIAATPRPNAFAVQSRAFSVPMPDRPASSPSSPRSPARR